MRVGAFVCVAVAAALPGCVQIPVRDGIAAADVNAIVRKVKCDLATVVLEKAMYRDMYGNQPFLFLRSWAAKVHLTLVVDDTGAIMPGASYTTPLKTVNGVAQSFSLGVGGGFTTQVQRQEDVEFLLSFKDINTEYHRGDLDTPLYHFCAPESGLLLESDLGLKPFIDAALKPVETGILTPGNNIGPNAGPPTAIPKDDYRKVTPVTSPPVDRNKSPDEPLNKIADKVPKNALVFKQLKSKFKITPDIAEMDSEQLKLEPKEVIDNAAIVKKLLANSVDATTVETKTQAMINDIVKPRYAIAQPSLDSSCLDPITQAQYDAIAQSANVSSFVVKVDKAAEKAAAISATPAEIAQALDESADALDAANKGRDAVIAQINIMAGKMSDCTKATIKIKAAAKKAGPPLYDPISTITETVNFYITLTGNVTPTWKLVQVTAPNSSTFISGTRKDTNTMVLTMGRPTIGANGEAKASDSMNNQLLYSILGQALTATRP